jgi:predicted GNAT family acetyltransferase
MSDEQNSTSMLIRGADGSLYFVNDEDLAPFRLTSEQEKAVNEHLDTENQVLKVDDGTLLAQAGLKPSASAVIMIVSVSALRNWRKKG